MYLLFLVEGEEMGPFFKKCVGGIVLTVFVGYGVSNAAGDIWGTTTVAKWKNNKQGAMSLTFDDNSWDRVTQAGILEEYGLRGTFNVVTSELAPYAAMFQDLSNSGHEIGSHSATHLYMSGLTVEQIRTELGNSKTAIENLTGVPCVSFTYPYGDSSETVQSVMGDYYLSARGSDQWLPKYPNIPVNGIGQSSMYFLTQGPSPPYGGDPWTDEQYLDIQEQYTQVVLNAQGWGINMFHDLAWSGHDQNDGSYTREEFLRAYCQYLATGEGSALWVAPQGTVARYYLEWLGATLQTISETEEAMTLQLNFSGSTALYNEPLTLLTEIPFACRNEEFTITQGGVLLSYRVIQAGTQTLLMYDALPGGGTITLAPEPTTIVFVGLILLGLLAKRHSQVNGG
jgi:peptidoglycan/xylan/chitin deacetylase (PgdA/CDA1 family)